MDDKPIIFFFCLSIVFGLAWIVTFARWDMDALRFKIEAIRHGAAEWRVREDGTTEFHWKDQPTKP